MYDQTKSFQTDLQTSAANGIKIQIQFRYLIKIKS